MKLGRAAWIKILLVVTLAVIVAAAPEPVVTNGAQAKTNKEAVKSISEIQHKLLTAMNSRQSTVRFKYEGQTKSLKAQLKNALDQAMESDPYIHYTVESYSYDYSGTLNSADVTVRLTYRETGEQTAYVEKRVQEILAEIIRPGMSDHEKVKVIHDWVVLNLKYDTSLQKYTAYDGLSTGSTVCQGYSLLTYKLLKEAGITNRIVEGTAFSESSPQGQLHAWNLVKLGEQWYHLDTTWNDPVPNRDGKVSYTYYLRSDQQMSKDHTWTKNYPAADTAYRMTLKSLAAGEKAKASVYSSMIKELDYHLYEASSIVRTYKEMIPMVKAAESAGNKELVFRFDGNEKELLQVLKDWQRKAGAGDIRYYQSEFEDTEDLKVHIYW